MGSTTARHLADETLTSPASYLTVARGDRVFDLFGWAAGRVIEVRVTGDKLFDGLVIEFRDTRLFVDAPEVREIYEGVVHLGVTTADLARAANRRWSLRAWPRGPRQPAPRDAAAPADHDDAVALIASLSRCYVDDRLELPDLECNVERVLLAGTCGDLDAIAREPLDALTPG
jgi:hypothetical protein